MTRSSETRHHKKNKLETRRKEETGSNFEKENPELRKCPFITYSQMSTNTFKMTRKVCRLQFAVLVNNVDLGN